MASGAVAEVITYGRISRVLVRAKAAQLISARAVPVPAVSSTFSPLAYWRDICVFTPTPVPTAMAVMTS